MKKKHIFLWGIVGIAVLIAAFLPGYTKLNDLKLKNKILQENLEKLKAENTKLTQERKLLSKDLFYIERIARKDLGVVKKGETIYKIEKK